MLLGEVLQRIQSTYSRGVQSQDSRLTPRHIYHALMTARSTVIRNQYNKNQLVNQWAYQYLSCVELIKAPIHECPCAPIAGCQILRTKHKIPTPISGLESHIFQSISSIDGSLTFDETTFDTVKYTKANKYTSTKSRFYPKNEYIYLVNVKEMKAIVVPGVFDDPVAAYMFPSICECQDCDCRDIMEMTFPIDGYNADDMFKLAHKELIFLLKQMGEDKNADATENEAVAGLIHKPE